ncbi:nicotinate (nicotinamide) nucleotide adenylyltransferase [Staphylococcus lutrae]|uniref:Probable nicotinate-nucleotide adenylyltransferase n=1 Tax=Staphylococcus lutrae TaxID=155085 RepID=A0AAC9WI83_9STAP|nr:nicotinate (nicotinamide) nucleotide adenylyltransferase [Staphylococcus lutrae]ARJ49904.1 nicotinate (nicotinamide) nucleotide adenylyltransferase [Staphylococcus lutrae]PNZ38621.1 nicotinate (nicotinamide) nucleotide adenylyltransferase [Staphylococcus lutrae]
MENIVVYGGQFNPIHSGHEMVASEVNAKIQPDHFYFMPSYMSPLKKHDQWIDVAHRIHMVKLVIQNLGFGTLRLDEIERKGNSYTYETMLNIQRESPDAKLYFVIGTDQYEQLDRWYQIDRLKQFVTFIVVNRGYEIQANDTAIITIHIPEMAISSTEIRHRRTNDQTIHMWVPLNVEQYILKERLYGANICD